MSVKVRYRPDKKRWQVRANHCYMRKSWFFESQDDAETFARSVRSGIKDTGKISANSKSKLPTLSGYFKRFESGHMKTVKPKTAEGYDGAFTNYIEPVLGHTPIDELNRQLIKKFVDDLKLKKYLDKDKKEHPLARDTVRLIISTLRKVLNEAVDDGLIASNPASRLGVRYRELPKVHEIDPFSEEEIIKLLSEAADSCPYWFPYFACLFHAGLRPGEGVRLKWLDVDFKRRVLNIRITKTGKSRRVEMTDSLHSILKHLLIQRKKEWETVPGYVFCTSTATMPDIHNIRFQRFNPLLDKAKMKRRGLHQLRHSFATIHIQNGSPIEWVSRQLGHADISTTFRYYYHYLPERQKEKYTDALPAIASRKTDNLIVMKKA